MTALSPALRRRGARYGTMRYPVRTGSSLTLNSPDGWVASQGGPMSWAAAAAAGGMDVWWLGDSQADWGPIGPNGPYPTSGPASPVVTRATSLLVDPLTTGRFRVRQGLALEPAPRWATDPMLLRPDARFGTSTLPAAQRLPRSLFWRLLLAQAIWWGRGFLYFLEDAAGAPIPGTLRLVAGHLVDTTEDGRWDIDGYEFDAEGRRNGGRLVCLRNPHTDLGVFNAHPDTFALTGRVDGYALNTFRSGVPAGLLKVTTPNLTKGQAEDLKAAWRDAHGGDERSVAVLNATTDFTPLAWSPVDSAWAEVKRLNVADVAYAFGMAPETLGVTLGNSATYSNVAQWFEAHRDFALSPWIAVLEGTLSALLPVGSDLEVNLDAYTKPDFASRMAAYQVAISAGVFTVDECRALEGLEALPEPEPAPAPPALEAAGGPQEAPEAEEAAE